MIGCAVGGGYVPGTGAAVLSGLGLLRGLDFRMQPDSVTLPEVFKPQEGAGRVLCAVFGLHSRRGIHASLPLQLVGGQHIVAPPLENSQPDRSQEEHGSHPLVNSLAISVVHPG